LTTRQSNGLRNLVHCHRNSKSLPTNVRDSVFQNCVFQLSAILEDYVLELLETWTSNLKKNKRLNGTLPQITRSIFIARLQSESYKRYIGLGNEVELAESMLQNSSAYKLLDDLLEIPQIDFRSHLIKDKKFPSPNNLLVLFRRFGMQNILSQLSKRTKSDFRLSLQAFMDIRNALAHESPPSLTDVDVQHYFDQILRWIEAIDREFYSHAVKCAGAQSW